ncbi:glycoprotein [Wenling dimarhabdovirus 8]|uniref:Glycoprotein n=1 Tax=Wenling dimarhabdovirus 8 TaxID=2116361 RepID=A0A2P1GMS8_9RHAB|nr:glycoprotein [Wenling dimarhabdovirus 8]
MVYYFALLWILTNFVSSERSSESSNRTIRSYHSFLLPPTTTSIPHPVSSSNISTTSPSTSRSQLPAASTSAPSAVNVWENGDAYDMFRGHFEAPSVLHPASFGRRRLLSFSSSTRKTHNVTRFPLTKIAVCPSLDQFHAIQAAELSCDALFDDPVDTTPVNIYRVLSKTIYVTSELCLCTGVKHYRRCFLEFFGSRTRYGSSDTQIIPDVRICTDLCQSLVETGRSVLKEGKILEPGCYWMRDSHKTSYTYTAFSTTVKVDRFEDIISSPAISGGVCSLSQRSCQSIKPGRLIFTSQFEEDVNIGLQVVEVSVVQWQNVPAPWFVARNRKTNEGIILRTDCARSIGAIKLAKSLTGAIFSSASLDPSCSTSLESSELPALVDFPSLPSKLEQYRAYVSCQLHKGVILNSITLGNPVHSVLLNPFQSLGQEENSEGKVDRYLISTGTLLQAKCEIREVNGLRLYKGNTWIAYHEDQEIACISGELQLGFESNCIARNETNIPILLGKWSVHLTDNGYTVVPLMYPIGVTLKGLETLSNDLKDLNDYLNKPITVNIFDPDAEVQNDLGEQGEPVSIWENFLEWIGWYKFKAAIITIFILVCISLGAYIVVKLGWCAVCCSRGRFRVKRERPLSLSDSEDVLFDRVSSSSLRSHKLHRR